MFLIKKTAVWSSLVRSERDGTEFNLIDLDLGLFKSVVQ